MEKTVKAIATLPSVALNDWLSGKAITSNYTFGSWLWLALVACDDKSKTITTFL